MTSYYAQISGASPWADGSVRLGDHKTIDVQFLSGNITAGSAGGLLSNRDWPTAPDGPMVVSGNLTVNMNYAVSTMYFGYGYSTVGSYTQPTITSTGTVTIIGSGAFDGTNFINFVNTTHNYGTLTIENLSLYSGDANSAIDGTGTLNLLNARSFGNIGNYNACMVGSITGGQTINMFGSDLAVYTTLKDVTINMSGGGNYLALRPTTTVSNVTVTGFSRGDIIDVPFTADADTWYYNPRTGDLTVTSTTFSHTVTIGLGYDPAKFSSAATAFPNMRGVTYQGDAPCFLSGTMILTARGEVAVEDLKAGDMIVTMGDAHPTARVLKALRRGSVNTRLLANLPPDEAYRPVIIEANAFGENRPSQDLHVTSDHCFAFEGRLIPIRTLVNGTTIRYDFERQSYEFFHLELDTHSLIIANGTETESYYREGERALPLATCPQFIYKISADISSSESERSSPEVAYSGETGIGEMVVKVDNSPTTIKGEKQDSYLKFAIPAGTSRVHLISEAQRPCDLIGPFYDDRRYLGHLVGSITYYGATETISLTEHLSSNALTGWHDRESPHCRWTKGHATVTLPTVDGYASGILWVEIVSDVSAPWIASTPASQALVA